MTQHPPVHHPNNPVLGFHGWDRNCPTGVSVLGQYFIFLLLIFFPARFFSLAQFFFFFLGIVFLSLFSWPIPDPKFLLGSSYLPQPTHWPFSSQPTYIPHPTNPLPTHFLLRSLPSPKLSTWKELE